MYLTNGCVRFRHPRPSFYILANSMSCRRLYFQPSYHNQSHRNNCPLQRVIVGEVEGTEEGRHGDVKIYGSIVDVGTKQSVMGTVDEPKRYETKGAIGNGNLDTLLYSPASIGSSLSERTELIAENIDPVGPEIEGDINANESSKCAVEDANTAVDRVEDEAVVGGVMEGDYGVAMELEVDDKIGSAAERTDFGSCSSVERIQAKPAFRTSLRMLKKSKAIGRNRALALSDWPKKKWITRDGRHESDVIVAMSFLKL